MLMLRRLSPSTSFLKEAWMSRIDLRTCRGTVSHASRWNRGALKDSLLWTFKLLKSLLSCWHAVAAYLRPLGTTKDRERSAGCKLELSLTHLQQVIAALQVVLQVVT
jgi:hypothetical protein